MSYIIINISLCINFFYSRKDKNKSYMNFVEKIFIEKLIQLNFLIQNREYRGFIQSQLYL